LRSRVALEVGRSIASSPIYRDATQGPPSGIIEGVNPYTGKATLVAYERLRGYPMYAAVTRQRRAFLADWSVQRRDTWVLAAAITILVAMTTLFLDHFLRVLRLREQHYRTLFNNAGFSAFVLQDTRFIEANRTSASMFGVSDASQLLGLTPWDLSPPRQPNGRPSEERAGERIREALAKGSNSFEWLHKRLSDDQPFHATVDISSLQIGNTTLSLAVVHDVTQRKLAELERERLVRELQELAGTLVRIQDDERRRIGRELHDATGQTLAALELKLGRLGRAAVPLTAAQRDLLAECVQLAPDARHRSARPLTCCTRLCSMRSASRAHCDGWRMACANARGWKSISTCSRRRNGFPASTSSRSFESPRKRSPTCTAIPRAHRPRCDFTKRTARPYLK
jgi:PAS domain S-box-containing protein